MHPTSTTQAHEDLLDAIISDERRQGRAAYPFRDNVPHRIAIQYPHAAPIMLHSRQTRGTARDKIFHGNAALGRFLVIRARPSLEASSIIEDAILTDYLARDWRIVSLGRLQPDGISVTPNNRIIALEALRGRFSKHGEPSKALRQAARDKMRRYGELFDDVRVEVAEANESPFKRRDSGVLGMEAQKRIRDTVSPRVPKGVPRGWPWLDSAVGRVQDVVVNGEDVQSTDTWLYVEDLPSLSGWVRERAE